MDITIIENEQSRTQLEIPKLLGHHWNLLLPKLVWKLISKPPIYETCMMF